MSHRGLRRVEGSIYNDLNNVGRTAHPAQIFNRPYPQNNHTSALSRITDNDDAIHQQENSHDQTYSDTATESGDDVGEIITIYAGFDFAGSQAELVESGRTTSSTRDTSDLSNSSANLLQPSIYTPGNSSPSASSGSSNYHMQQLHVVADSKPKQEMQEVGKVMETSDISAQTAAASKPMIRSMFEVARYPSEEPSTSQPISPPLSAVKGSPSINLAADDADDEQSVGGDDDLSSVVDSEDTVLRTSKFIIDSSHNLPREVATYRGHISSNSTYQHPTALQTTYSTSSLESTGSQDTVRTFDVTPSIAESEATQSVPEMGIAEAIALHHVLATEARSSTEYDESTPPHLRTRTLRHAHTVSVQSNGSPMIRESESFGDIGEAVRAQRYFARDTDSEVLGSDDLPIIVSGDIVFESVDTSSNDSRPTKIGEAMAFLPHQYNGLPPSKSLGVDRHTANASHRVSVNSQILRHRRYDIGVTINVDKEAKDFLLGIQPKTGEPSALKKKSSSADGSTKSTSSYSKSETSSKSKSSGSSKTRSEHQAPVPKPRPKANQFDFRFMMGPEAPEDRPSDSRGSRTLSARPSYESSTFSEKSKLKLSSDQLAKHNRNSQYSQLSESQASSSAQKRGKSVLPLQEQKNKQLREGARAPSPSPSEASETSVATIKATGLRGRFSHFKLFGGDKKSKHEQSGASVKHENRIENIDNAPSHRPRNSLLAPPNYAHPTVPRHSQDTRSVIDEARSIMEDAQLTMDDGESTYSDIPSSTGEAIDRAINDCKTNFDDVLRRTLAVTDPAVREMLHGILVPLATAISNTNVARNASLQLEVAIGNLALQTSQGIDEAKRRLDAAGAVLAEGTGPQGGVER